MCHYKLCIQFAHCRLSRQRQITTDRFVGHMRLVLVTRGYRRCNLYIGPHIYWMSSANLPLLTIMFLSRHGYSHCLSFLSVVGLSLYWNVPVSERCVTWLAACCINLNLPRRRGCVLFFLAVGVSEIYSGFPARLELCRYNFHYCLHQQCWPCFECISNVLKETRPSWAIFSLEITLTS